MFSGESETSVIDETQTAENEGTSYGEVESSFAAQGGQMSFDDDNIRIAVASVSDDEVSVFLTHKDSLEPARTATVPHGSILVFAGYRIEVSGNGNNGFADVAKETTP